MDWISHHEANYWVFYIRYLHEKKYCNGKVQKTKIFYLRMDEDYEFIYDKLNHELTQDEILGTTPDKGKDNDLKLRL